MDAWHIMYKSWHIMYLGNIDHVVYLANITYLLDGPPLQRIVHYPTQKI
jgi:hypothetical protein